MELKATYRIFFHPGSGLPPCALSFLIRNVYNNDDVLTQVKYEQGSTPKTLFTATDMNSHGIYTAYSTGNGKASEVTYNLANSTITRYYTPGIQDLNFVYEANSINLLSREDAIRNLTETFTYDTYDRLTGAKVNSVEQFAINYDNNALGKIMQKTDIGNYVYDNQKIHQLKYLTAIPNGGTDPAAVIGTGERNITYTSFLKTQSITENGYQLTYTYGSDQQRLTSTLKQGGTTIETKTYWGDVEVQVKGGVTREIYYIAAGNGLNNIIVKQGSAISIYYAYTDRLGSIIAVTNEAGTIVAEQNFDAWGRYRNPADWSYTNIPANPDWLYRGFTGHEHITVVALINMNGRMYDPMTALMLSPDNYVPMPFSPGGYNRYIYANGNPLKFVDPDGEFFWLPVIIGAIIGGVTNGVAHVNNGVSFFGGFWRGALVGAAAGVAGGGIANIAAGGSFFGNAAAQTVGFWAGAGSGAAGGAVGGFIGSAGNAWLNGAGFGQGLMSGLKGAAIGGLAGGLSSGISSEIRKVKIEGVGPIEATDEFLRKAQESWYPNAPMDKVKEFTIENISLDAHKEFYYGALGATIAEKTPEGLYTGYSSVYFNPFKTYGLKELYFTMGHELIHVSQISFLANVSLVNLPSQYKNMMEFAGYGFEAHLGKSFSSNSFSSMVRDWVRSPFDFNWLKKINFYNFPVSVGAKYRFVWP